MDDSFRLRVEKVFRLLASSPSSPLKSSLWSITDDEVERKEWRRSSSQTSEMPCSSSFDDYLNKDRGISPRTDFGEDQLEGLDDDRDEDLDGAFGRGQDDQDEWSIRSSIALDCTLDYEEEEDEYDKVACGREDAGDRLYMGDVTEHKSYLNSYNSPLEMLLHGTVKDPGANHLAAKARVKEDEAPSVKSNLNCAAEIKEPYIKASKDDTPRPKSILKRRSSEANSKSQKRVRFNLGSKIDCGGASNVLYYGSQNASGIPDFVVNPSKFSRDTSNSSEDEDGDDTSAQSCRNFTSQVKSFGGRSGSELENGLTDLPKSLTFVSKRQSSDSKAVNDGSEVKQNKEGDSKQSVFPVGIAAGGEAEDDVNTDDKNSHF